MKKLLFILIIFNFQFSNFHTLQAQADRQQLRDGNRSYKKEKYDKAEVQYYHFQQKVARVKASFIGTKLTAISKLAWKIRSRACNCSSKPCRTIRMP